MRKKGLRAIAILLVLMAAITTGIYFKKVKVTPNDRTERLMTETINPIKKTEENNGDKVITPISYIDVQKEKTPLYENRGGALTVVGYLNFHQEFPIQKDLNKNWYVIKFGNSLADVNKNAVSLTSVSNYQNANKQYLNTNIVVITKKDAPVYDLTNKTPVEFATIKENRRYPILYSDNKRWAVDLGGRIGFVDKALTKVDRGIPVLMYHHFLKASENKNFRTASTITPDEFKQQMDYLHKNGYETITTEEMEQYIKGEVNLSGKAVLLTFDDGEKSVYLYAYPILKQYGMKATEFLITSRNQDTPQPFNPATLQFISKPEMMKMKDIFEFQAHTHQLHNVNKEHKSDLVTKPADFVLKDLLKNKSILNATAFAYPFGQYNDSTIKLLKQVGFQSAYTTNPGYNNVGDNLYLLKRFEIRPGTSLSQFVSIVGNKKV